MIDWMFETLRNAGSMTAATRARASSTSAMPHCSQSLLSLRDRDTAGPGSAGAAGPSIWLTTDPPDRYRSRRPMTASAATSTMPTLMRW